MKAPVWTSCFSLLILALFFGSTTTTADAAFTISPLLSPLPGKHHGATIRRAEDAPAIATARRHKRGSSTELNMIGRLFRRDKSKKRGVKTLEREKRDTKKDEKKKEPIFRVMMYATEAQPQIVARIVAKIIPSLSKMAAYELCLYAKSTPAQKVLLVLASRKQAEQYCLRLRKRGLPVTIEPHDVER